MDPLTLVPENEDDHDVLPIITEAFQYSFCTNRYPRDVAEYITKYGSNIDNKELKEHALTVIKIKETKETCKENIRQAEKELMRTHALAFVEKYNISKIQCKDALQLKRHSIFEDLSEHAIQAFSLIQKCDIYPNKIEKYLDFTFNPSLHTCKPCREDKIEPKPTLITKSNTCNVPKLEPLTSPVLELDPEEIVFKNYDLNKTYKQKLKLRNVSTTPQIVTYCDFPLNSPFRLQAVKETAKIASGMFLEFIVVFKPLIYRDHNATVQFRTSGGSSTNFLVSCMRDPPKLVCYVFNPILSPEIEQPGPGSRYFSERRRDALNSTIDCGTCLLGSHSLVTVVMKNFGQKGRFFITTEFEWCFNELKESPTRAKELTQGCFSIFPAYFEIDNEEIGEIFIIFTPDKEGVFTERLFVICDNNSYQELELLGDAILFSNSFLKVNLCFNESTFSYALGLITITLPPYQNAGFAFIVVNKSPVCFEYYWAIKAEKQRDPARKHMDLDWLQILNPTSHLPSFSFTDVHVQLCPKTEQEGVYHSFISLYLKNLPISSMPEYQFLIIIEDEENSVVEKGSISKVVMKHEVDDLFLNNIGYADVHISELEVLCVVKKETPEPQEAEFDEIECIPKDLKVPPPTPRLKISKQFLHFGVIPKGVQASRSFYIENLTDEMIYWKLAEISWSKDMQMDLIKDAKNLNRSKGILRRKGKKRKITYSIEADSCTRWISILALFSSTSCTCEDFVLEELCLVSYEISEIKIVIRTSNLLPVLCPKEFIYVDIPSIHTINIHNVGAVIGCFYFLKLTGEESSKIRVRFQPQSGVILPGATVEVKVELVALESGVFEDIHVPCFVGNPEKLISLRIICSVASINVFFHLPEEEAGFKKILWPPQEHSKFHSYYDVQKCDAEWAPKEERILLPEAEEVPEVTITEPDPSLQELIAPDSVAATYPTVKVKTVFVKKPTKIKFLMENVTPVFANFTVDATNYSPDVDCINNILVRAKTRPPEFFWESECQNGYGIVIEPQRASGDVVPYEVVEIELWIYANTWGKYLEEIIVEINDLTPFCFNLIIEVIGTPLEFPFARNTILKYPTIRFNDVNHTDDGNVRSFTVTNISSVSVFLSWYVFIPEEKSTGPFNAIISTNNDLMKFDLSKECYGATASAGCIELSPLELELEKGSTATMTITIKTSDFPCSSSKKTSLQYDLICFIYLKEEDIFKENYFRRVDGVDLAPSKVKVLATLETPKLEVESCADETVINLFVNDILLKDMKDPEVYLVLRNVYTSPIYFSLQIEKPFYIDKVRTIPTDITDSQNLVLHRNECLQVSLKCHLSHEEIAQFAEFIYMNKDKFNDFNTISVIKKNLEIYQQGIPRQFIPFEVRLHYPRIKIKPLFMKFGQCLLYNTKKMFFSIYNLTGSPVIFEVYKSTKRDDFEVNPYYGLIPGNTGVNQQFVDVAVYFTPRDCRLYIESLRIVTNIPQYFIDLPVTGYGTSNEKFYVG